MRYVLGKYWFEYWWLTLVLVIGCSSISYPNVFRKWTWAHWVDTVLCKVVHIVPTLPTNSIAERLIESYVLHCPRHNITQRQWNEYYTCEQSKWWTDAINNQMYTSPEWIHVTDSDSGQMFRVSGNSETRCITGSGIVSTPAETRLDGGRSCGRPRNCRQSKWRQ